MESSSLKQLSVLMATVFVDMIGFTMVLPLLPFYATELGANALAGRARWSPPTRSRPARHGAALGPHLRPLRPAAA